MKTLSKKIISLFLALTMAFSLSASAFAATNKNDPDILQVLIVSDDGCFLYQGDNADTAFNDLNNGTLVNSPKNKIASSPVLHNTSSVVTDPQPTPGIEPYSLTYKYRFIPNANNKTKVYGNYSIISDVWGNDSSITQDSTFSFTASASGSVNRELSGKYLDAVEAKIGTSYTKTFSTTTSITNKVPAHKRVWLQYKPEYVRYSGTSQKYFITRRSHQLIVENSCKVDILEASERSINLAGKTLTLPNGAYAWCEDNDYLSSRPPVIKH